MVLSWQLFITPSCLFKKDAKRKTRFLFSVWDSHSVSGSDEMTEEENIVKAHNILHSILPIPYGYFLQTTIQPTWKLNVMRSLLLCMSSFEREKNVKLVTFFSYSFACCSRAFIFLFTWPNSRTTKENPTSQTSSRMDSTKLLFSPIKTELKMKCKTETHNIQCYMKPVASEEKTVRIIFFW